MNFPMPKMPDEDSKSSFGGKPAVDLWDPDKGSSSKPIKWILGGVTSAVAIGTAGFVMFSKPSKPLKPPMPPVQMAAPASVAHVTHPPLAKATHKNHSHTKTTAHKKKHKKTHV